MEMTSALVSGCTIARECGGCSRIGEPYDGQLQWKHETLRQAFAAYAELGDVAISECVPSAERWHYRNRAKLAVSRSGDGLRVGLYRRGSNEIIDLAPCVVQRPVLQSGLEALRRWLDAHGLVRPVGPVFYVDLREASEGRCHATLVVDGEGFDPSLLPLDSLFADWPNLAGIAVNLGDPRSSYPLGERTIALRGADHFEAYVQDGAGVEVAFAVPLGGFFQVSTSLLPDIHRRMAEHLGEGRRLYDLYCGAGVHGVMVARATDSGTQEVVGIEDSEPACRAAQGNAARHGVPAAYHSGRVEKIFGALLESCPSERFILNPGRAGCRPAVLQALATVASARIAYLSCDPATLARDLARLSGHGKKIVAVTPYDLMPHTDHIETLALLE
jgi:23S rRNA (uracil1939-C5)-methyltransferase